jgi:hypothetical protein
MGGACSTNGLHDTCVQDFSRLRLEIILGDLWADGGIILKWNLEKLGFIS